MGYMSMIISLKVSDTQSEIARKIGNALLPDIRKYMQESMRLIMTGLPGIVNSAITGSYEYASLLGGALRYELGIPDAGAKIAGLLDVWSQNIDVNYTPPIVNKSGTISSKFSVSMIKIDFGDVLYTPYAQVYDTERGYNLPWLQWLLLEGNQVLIQDYVVVVGRSPRSRTGMATMREEAGGSWSVPMRYAGTMSDNWITRSLSDASKEIEQFIIKVLDR